MELLKIRCLGGEANMLDLRILLEFSLHTPTYMHTRTPHTYLQHSNSTLATVYT